MAEDDKKVEMTNEMVKNALQMIAQDANPKVKAGMEKMYDNVMNKGMPIKDALGMKLEMVEGLYSHAYFLYNAGRYDDAVLLFQILVLLNAADPKYTMGLAACLHMKKSYLQAGEMYALAGILDKNNPIPYYHAADCWMNLNQNDVAIDNLKLAISLSAENPEYAVIKDRCTLTLASLNKTGKAPAPEGKKIVES